MFTNLQNANINDSSWLLKEVGCVSLEKKVGGMVMHFVCGHVWMWELDCEEGWVPKNWCFWTVVLEKKTLESPLDCKEIQPVHSEGHQPWDFFGRNDAEAETPVLRPPHAKSRPIGKDSDGGRDWGQEEKGLTEDEMAGWHHWLDGCESEWTLGVGDGQGGLACCISWGHRESDTTERLIWMHFVNGKGSRSDLQVSFSEWESNIMNKESDKDFVESGPWENEFCVWSVLNKIKINLTE